MSTVYWLRLKDDRKGHITTIKHFMNRGITIERLMEDLFTAFPHAKTVQANVNGELKTDFYYRHEESRTFLHEDRITEDGELIMKPIKDVNVLKYAEFGLADITLEDADGKTVHFDTAEYRPITEDNVEIDLVPEFKEVKFDNKPNLADQIDNIRKSLAIRKKHLIDDSAESIYLLILNNTKNYREAVQYAKELKLYAATKSERKVMKIVYDKIEEDIGRKVDDLIDEPFGPF